MALVTLQQPNGQPVGVNPALVGLVEPSLQAGRWMIWQGGKPTEVVFEGDLIAYLNGLSADGAIELIEIEEPKAMKRK